MFQWRNLNIFFSIVGMPLSNKSKIIKQHNEFMRAKGEAVIKLCGLAISNLMKVLEQ